MIIATKDKSHRRVSQIFFPVNNNHDNVLSSKMEFEFHRVVVNIFPHTHAHTYIYVYCRMREVIGTSPRNKPTIKKGVEGKKKK